MCKFTLADMRIIGTALKSNRVLRGIHSLGNEGTVDSILQQTNPNLLECV